ncbi:MAG: DNA polymerase III, partial [Magnetospirillum sp.]|nr:DNA polymerase III [Magnetospirillum sp.]
ALTLEVVGKPQLPPPNAALAPAKPEGLTAQGWPAFTQAMDALSAGNQAQAMEQLLRVMPQAGPRLAASMAMFAGAVRSGEARALIPETAARGLEKAGKKELLERLKADLSELAEESGRPVGNGQWQGFTMPFLNGTIVEPINLFIRRTDAEESQRKKGGSGNEQRFVLDLRLTQLGRVQMDGLVRREDKLFDLIIRTDAPLTQETRHGILGIFTNSSELVGTTGSVSFHSGGRWVEFPPDPPPPTRIEV